MWFEPFVYPSLWTLAALATAVWALRRATVARREIAELRRRLEQAPPAAQVAASAAVAGLPAEPVAPADRIEEAVSAPPRPGKVWGGGAPSEEPASDAPGPPPAALPAAAATAPGGDLERRLASRWLVWLGGVAIAIGGVLFIKYAVETGLLSPALRCLVGAAFGLLLIGAGERLRRSRPRGSATGEPDYVPPALTAAGLLIAFASIYAAHAWYGLLGPAPAFALFAGVAFAGLSLALAQGPLIAALGLLGAYGTPALIPATEPAAWAFFPYLLIVQAACFAILRRRSWAWLGYLALAGNLAWVLLWLTGGVFEAADQPPIGLFLLATAAIAVFAVAGARVLDDEAGDLAALATSPPAFRLAAAGLATGAAGLLALLQASDHSTMSLWLLSAGLAGALALAWSGRGFALAAPIAGLLAFIALMAWHNAAFFELAMDEQGLWSSVLGPGARRFLSWMLSLGGALTLAALAGLRSRPPPLAWAVLAAGAPVLFLWGAWARVDSLLPEPQWAAIAAVPAIVLSAAVFAMRRSGDEPGMERALGLLVIGASILAVFLFDRLWNGVWLTLAIAALVPVLALVGRGLQLGLVGPLAAGLASLAALRLFIARELLEERRDLPLGLHWPLYGYGLPALAFWWSSRRMQEAYRRSAMALEGTALALAIALASLELRVLIGGGFYEEPGLLEAAPHILAWLGAAYGLMHRLEEAGSPVRLWAARLLLAAACAALVLVNLIALNPVISEEPLPGNAVFNALLLAYLAPAALLGLIALRLRGIGWRPALPAVGVLCLVLVLAYVTLETKRLFQGRLMVLEWLSQPESYAYSAVWLATALALLIAGIRFGSPPVRYGGLAIIVLTVAKVFLIDLSDLTGLYRVASFAGLGLCLVGIGYLYTRFLHQPSLAAATAG